MPLFIKHRVNTIAGLDDVHPAWGVEIDLRSDVRSPGDLHLSHDPWKKGESFRAWLRAFKRKKIRGPIILNTKEDGLEEQALRFMKQFKVARYFFLDTAFPTLVKWTVKNHNRNFALRFSRYENKQTLSTFAGLAQWVWVDCFDGKPMNASHVHSLRRRFKICLVSPELQGRPVEEIGRFRKLAAAADAICTKRPDVWRAAGAGIRSDNAGI